MNSNPKTYRTKFFQKITQLKLQKSFYQDLVLAEEFSYNSNKLLHSILKCEN